MHAFGLTVCVPNYNHACYLPRSLDSILSQSRLPDEILICDDASTDNSLEIIEEYARNAPIIRVIQNASNQGVMATHRRLVSSCRTPLVSGCASDDELCPGFIESAMQSAERHPELGMHVGQMIFRRQDETSGETVDQEVKFGKSCVLSAQEYQTAPAFLDSCFQYGLSIAAVYRTNVLLEALRLSEELGPQSDILERSFVAAKYGVSVLDVPGEIFHLISGGFSRQAGPEFALATARRYLDLCRTIRGPDLRGYFPDPLASKLTRAWTTVAFNNLDGQVSGAYHIATSGYYKTFKAFQLPGLTVGRFLAKLTGIGRELQMRWLRRCLRAQFNREMKQRPHQTSR